METGPSQAATAPPGSESDPLAGLSPQRQLERALALIAEQNRTIDELRTAFGHAENRRELASVELEAARRRIQQLSSERDTLRSARDRLALTSTDLHTRRDELRIAKLHVASLQTDLATQAERLQQVEAELAAARQAPATSGTYPSMPAVSPPWDPSDTLSRRESNPESAVIHRPERLTPQLVNPGLEASAVNAEFMETVAESALSGRKERVLVPINHDGEIIVLDRPTMTIGRTRANDVRIKSKAISRHHATLAIGPELVTVEDAGSTNGCQVNGQRITQGSLHDGDILELGDLQYRLSTRHVHAGMAASTDSSTQAQIIQVSAAGPSDAARREIFRTP
ncbi:MAG TPA: FHA domain-containing protein [Steroidobacteraceae bacterium]|jgi:hypothetical protein